MRSVFFVCVVLIFNFSASAQQKRALVIGIDNYSPPEGAKVSNASGRIDWPTLDGCKNDAQAIKAMIIDKYAFDSANIQELYDQQAKRQNILDAMYKILTQSNPGDIAFIYYAGHGSQVYNSLSSEMDHLDESMVPADAWQEGVDDLRDKTLAQVFNKFIDKGVVLTCIFDCCHSGSIGRGILTDPPKFRFIAQSNRDAKDPSKPPAPENRKNSRYLIMSAVQDNELAQEHLDENNTPHGAFTAALLQAMNRQSVDASATDLFVATRSILKSNNIVQEPVLAGDMERQKGTLFGLEKGVLSNKILVAVITKTDKKIILQGGFVTGLNVDNELSNPDSTTKLKITSILGPNRSEADVIKGEISSVKPGDMFAVSNWVSSSAPVLKIYAPDNSLDYNQVNAMTEVAKKLREQQLLVTDLKNESGIVLYFNDGKWYYNDDRKGKTSLPSFSVSEIKKVAGRQKVNLLLPSTAALNATLQSKYSVGMLELSKNPLGSQYTLAGSVNEKGDLCYGFVRSEVAPKDSLAEMPLQTKFFELKGSKESFDDLVDQLTEYSLRLAKVRAWLTMQAPKNENYPFHLEVRGRSNKPVDTLGIKIGEPISLYFVRENGFAARWDNKLRFIYVFDIDNQGKITLLYPNENDGNATNKFPKKDENDKPLPEMKLDGGYDLAAAEPTGTDSYYLLATEDAIPDFAVKFNQEGVRGIAASSSPLDELLNIGNVNTRGPAKIKTGNNWILQRVPVKTIR